MLKKLIPIIPIGLSIFVVILVLSYAVFVKPEPVVPVQMSLVNNDVTPTTTITTTTMPDDIPTISMGNFKTFQSDRLKISFKYPMEWGDSFEIEGDFSDLNGFHPSRIRVGIGNLKDNPVIILEADNGGDRMGRGGFTGDIVIDVDSQDYIKNFCQNRKNKNINKCEYKVNSNNINFVKYEDELCSEGGCFGKGLFYLMYNPNSEYRGILLYTYNIQRDKNIVNYKEEMLFDSLVDSLKFNK